MNPWSDPADGMLQSLGCKQGPGMASYVPDWHSARVAVAVAVAERVQDCSCASLGSRCPCLVADREA